MSRPKKKLVVGQAFWIDDHLYRVDQVSEERVVLIYLSRESNSEGKVHE